MDLIYDIFDELTGNSTASQSSSRPQGTENLANEGEDQNWSSSVDRSPTDTNPQHGNEEFPFYDASGSKQPETGSTQQGSVAPDSHTWERHTKNIQGEFSKASDPDQNRRVSKALESLGPKEGWLNLDDLDLSTEPSEFPPPSRPAPTRDTASSPSTSGQDRTDVDEKGKGKEKFFEKVTMTRKISYELVEEDVYDDDRGRHGGKLEDLIDISTVDSQGNEEKYAPDMSRKAEKQLGKVAKAIEEDLSVLFGDTSVPVGRKTAAHQKGKGVEGSGSGTQQQQREYFSERVSSSKGVEEMKQRDLKQQREMEEMARAAEELEVEFKKWSSGKEGNLRALLSSLQNILGPESGWQPVSLQDLLNSTSVRRQYRKATLLVHPDKLQQKGATPQQKYIAEKVFGVLKEASKKFNSEEIF